MLLEAGVGALACCSCCCCWDCEPSASGLLLNEADALKLDLFRAPCPTPLSAALLAVVLLNADPPPTPLLLAAGVEGEAEGEEEVSAVDGRKGELLEPMAGVMARLYAMLGWRCTDEGCSLLLQQVVSVCCLCSRVVEQQHLLQGSKSQTVTETRGRGRRGFSHSSIATPSLHSTSQTIPAKQAAYTPAL